MRKRTVGVIAGVVMFLVGMEDASAANGWETPLNTTSTATSQTSASIQLTMSGGRVEGTLDAANAAKNPDEAGKVIKEVATVKISNADSYIISASGPADLVGRNNPSKYIPCVDWSMTLGEMQDYRGNWGYYGVVSDEVAEYNPQATFSCPSGGSGDRLASGGKVASEETKTITMFYGARVTDQVAEDFYGGTMTLSVVAQPRTVTSTVATFNGITTMQEMTSTICKNAAENDTTRLRDTRDGKYYWVTKLLDGNCWMSQNLALDLSTSTALTSATSDVVSSWTPGRTTTSSVTTGSTTQTETYSWNLGNYVVINPTATTACSNNNTGLSACSGQFVAVGTRTPSTDPNFYETHGATYTATEYDAHYLAGNYYQWNAATAGTGGEITSQNATGSICPKNWKLPNSNSTAKNSFYYLLQQYGVQSKVNIAAGAVASPVNGNDYDIALSPLFFVRGGIVNLTYPNTPFQSAGQDGYYWSSRAQSDTRYAYYLNFDNRGIYPSNGGNPRYLGFPLRCLIPTA